MAWKKHLDKFGVVGSFVVAACCLGLPAVLSIVAAVGLGFIINDAILLPLLIVFLAATLLGLWLGYRAHGNPWALVVGGLSAAVLFVFIFVHTVQAIAYVAVGGLVGASILNAASRRKCIRAGKA